MQKKYKTKIGEEILAYVKENRDVCFCVADVADELASRGSRVNITTIYRNLDRLVDEGLLSKVKVDNENASYYRFLEQERNCHEHLHMRCRVCGKIYHIEGDLMKKIEECLTKDYEFHIECENSTISGVCKACQKKETNHEEE